MKNAFKLLSFALFAVLAGCSSTKDDDTTDGGAKDAAVADSSAVDAGGSIACSVPQQDRCHEYPAPSDDQRAAVTVECSSVSGAISTPATCPTAGFIGKCTIAATGKDGPEVRRWYKADDAAYQQDFCVNTAKGVWSTVF
ncbi:MAG: hypothetical protein JWP87_3979 [Labilithrix sp.]|nr:hypothetical protein [Labilithrix sp.]